jgi:hypothetical protein
VATFQCPECELRFQFAAELLAHLRDDHPDFHIEPKSVEDAMLLEAHHKRGHRNIRPESR